MLVPTGNESSAWPLVELGLSHLAQYAFPLAVSHLRSSCYNSQ